MGRDTPYVVLKTRSKSTVLLSSVLSNRFVRKYGIFCLLLLVILGYLTYRRILNQKYIYQTLPLYQRSIALQLNSTQDALLQYTDQWQFIGDPAQRLQIYSAYFDPRLEVVESFTVPDGYLPFGSVRIFAVLPLNIKCKDIYCTFKLNGTLHARHPADAVQAIHEHFDMEFSATYVVCKLVGSITNRNVALPDEVALSNTADSDIQDNKGFVRIKYPSTDHLFQSAPTRSLAVCVGPLHHDFSNALRMVEFFEYYRHNGVEYFYLYNKSATAEVNAVMQHYQKTGLVEVLEWNFDGYKFETEVRYEGIFAALNDCLYRTTIVGNFKYAVIVDFDELLFTPTNNKLLDYLEAHDRYDVHSFNFQGVFFYDFYKPDFSRVPKWTNNSYLYTQVRNIRTKNPLMHHNRSKYVLKSRNVLEAGNHRVWQAARDTYEYLVPENEGLLFHYRDGNLGYDYENCIEDNRARDRYQKELWREVDERCLQIFPTRNGKCPLGREYT